jgi:hypothetical protein
MIQKIAWVFGVVFIVIGVLGFVPSLAPDGSLFGVFSFDAMLCAIYLVSGALALLSAWSSVGHARLYFVYAIITVVGFIQGDTVFGLLTVNTADNVLHLVIAAVALWAGFGAKPEAGM